MATNPILSVFPLANLMVKKITTKARMKSACPQNVAFRFIKFLIDELPEKHITIYYTEKILYARRKGSVYSFRVILKYHPKIIF